MKEAKSKPQSAQVEAASPAEKPAAPPWLGKRVGHFKLIGLLGQGAMGRVFRVEDTLLRRYVALKVLPKSMKRTDKAIAIERLIHEAQACATLDHPNVVAVYEVNEAAGVYYIAMELAEGGSLRELVKAAGPLEYPRACVLGADAADALAHAHGLGIVHRDVKPANLMLTRSGRCKVTDFGLARGLDSSELSKPIPEAVGTPQFIAPELLRGEIATPQSDIYSLGATLWYVLTGRSVFEARGTADLLQKHIEAPVPDLKTLRPDIPGTLAKAIQKALAKQPGERFESASQFAKVLRVHTIPVESSNSLGLQGVLGGPEDTATMSLSRTRASGLATAAPAPEPTSAPAGLPATKRTRKWKAMIGLGCAAAALLAVAFVPGLKSQVLMHFASPIAAQGHATVLEQRAAAPSTPSAAPSRFMSDPAAQLTPPGWIPLDVGSPRLSGNTIFDGNTWTLSGAGVDIYFDHDQFHFVSKSFAGDGVFTTRVENVKGTSEHAKVGLMFRDGSAANAAFVDVLAEASGVVTFQMREAAGTQVTFEKIDNVKSPLWLKLLRTDDTFCGYYSEDGVNWHQVGKAETVPMPRTIRAGLAITSHDKTSLATATLTRVSLMDSQDAR